MMPNKYAACFLNKTTISKPSAEFTSTNSQTHNIWQQASPSLPEYPNPQICAKQSFSRILMLTQDQKANDSDIFMKMSKTVL